MNEKKKDAGRLAVLVSLTLASASLILGLTMWLVPWASLTAAGILVAVGVFVICLALALYASSIAKSAIGKKGITRKDERYKYAKDRAMALVGRVAVALLFAVSVLLIALGQVSATSFFPVVLGFFVLFLLVVAATLFYINKL